MRLYILSLVFVLVSVCWADRDVDSCIYEDPATGKIYDLTSFINPVFWADTDVDNCIYKDPATGKIYNLTSFINPAGYYTWTVEAWNINGFSVDTLVSDDKSNYTFYLQVCRNISTPPSSMCKDPGAIYSISGGQCISWGRADIAAFNVAPYKNGVFLQMYHGSVVDNTNRYASHIYFVCNKSMAARVPPKPLFEHIKAQDYQAHFKFFTPLVC